jgi:hypothetical protein
MTMSRSKPVVFKGQEFPSVKALRAYLGISKSAYYLRQFRGLAPDAVIPRSGFSKRVPVEVDGVRYPSIAAYARAAGLGRATARHRVMMAREHKDDRYLHPMPASKVCEYGGKYYRSHSAMDRALRLNRKSGEALREDHEMSVCRTKVADYYHLDGLEDPRLEGELVKDFIAEAKSQIKYRFSVRDVFGDRLERMAVLYAKDKAPKLTVQDDIYDLHLDMARVYLPDIENAEVESYNHAN